MDLKHARAIHRIIASVAVVAAVATAQAGFQYSPRDLVFGFRTDGGGTPEVTINGGQVSTYYNLPTGQTLTVSNVNATVLHYAFSAFDNLFWSCAADVRTNGDVAYPDGLRPYAYSYYMGAGGNYAGTFPGTVETATGPSFTSGGQPVRADFYQLLPGSGDGTYLGYFEFNPNGVMTYHSGPSQAVTIPRPTITGTTRVGTNTTVTFTTATGAFYSLRYTNSAGLKAPVSSWPTAGSAVTGNGTPMSISDPTADPLRFYSISAHN
jgi:hypothetical protein